MRFRSYRAGELICREGEPGESHVRDRRRARPGRVLDLGGGGDDRALSIFAEDRLVGKLRRGEVIGATSLITGEPRSRRSWRAPRRAVLELDGDAFRALIARFPRLLENLVRILGRPARARRRAARPRSAARRSRCSPSDRSRAPIADVVSAAAASSVRPRRRARHRATWSEALGRLDRLLHDHGTVILTAGLEREDRRCCSSTSIGRSCSPAVTTTRGWPGCRSRSRCAAWTPRRPRRTSPGSAVTSRSTKLGLALGAGGAKGYAHVGALYELEAAGYTVDYVGGIEHRRDRRRLHRDGDGRGGRRGRAARHVHARDRRRDVPDDARRRRRDWRRWSACCRRRRPSARSTTC